MIADKLKIKKNVSGVSKKTKSLGSNTSLKYLEKHKEETK